MPTRRGRNLSGAIRHESRATRARASNDRKGADETGDAVVATTAATGAATAAEGALSAAADTGITGDTSVADTRHSAGRN